MTNLNFKINNSHIDEESLISSFDELDDYQLQLAKLLDSEEWTASESSLLVPFNKDLTKPILDVVNNFKNDSVKCVFVVGIGGSSLGTMAIYKALVGRVDELKSSEGKCPKLIFIDTIDARLLEDISIIIDEQEIEVEEIIINIISKSGNTVEVIANSEFLLNELEQKFIRDQILDRIVVTTDKDSKLWKFSEKHNLIKLEVPKKVGGRYSVFTAVGLLPLALAGFDINLLLEGCASIIEQCFEDRNVAMESAAIQFYHYKRNIKIHNTFFLDPNLEYVGSWYSQLMAESLGKEINLNHEITHDGISPIVSLGTTDLHSKAQLYFGGPKDKLTTFVNIKNKPELEIGSKLFFEEIVEGLENKNSEDILSAFYISLIESYKIHNLPFVEIELEKIDEYSLAQFMQFKMLEIMYLAKLMNISAFNQPSVEEYKRLMKLALKT